MNNPFRHLNKIEFVITYACTGKCKHCSEGDHAPRGEHIDPAVAADVVRRVASEYDIQTVMTFGGEPLLYPDAVYAVMTAAFEMNIPRRQIITNGYFSRSSDNISQIARRLSLCGVNDIILSVDAFHQETIPLDVVKIFADEITKRNIPIRTQPAWLVSMGDNNVYNQTTKALLDEFQKMGISPSQGNIIFPEGNALRYLSEFFTGQRPANPYVEDPYDVRCISVAPNGDVLGGNIYKQDIMEIIKNYKP